MGTSREPTERISAWQHRHRPGSLLQITPYPTTLPDPHVLPPIPPPLNSPTDPNYFWDYPTYKWSSPPYIPLHLRPIIDRDDHVLYNLSPESATAWTRPSWGWVGFRTDYSISEEQWSVVKRRVWERYKFQGWDYVDKFRIIWIEFSAEEREKLNVTGAESLREFDIVRKMFKEWCAEHNADPAFDSYNRPLCLVADSRACREILADISSCPVLPELDPGLKFSGTDTSIVVLDANELDPREVHADVEGKDDEERPWEMDRRRYRGYLRATVDDVACLWGGAGGFGEVEELVVRWARKAKSQGGVWTFWGCT